MTLEEIKNRKAGDIIRCIITTDDIEIIILKKKPHVENDKVYLYGDVIRYNLSLFPTDINMIIYYGSRAMSFDSFKLDYLEQKSDVWLFKMKKDMLIRSLQNEGKIVFKLE